MDLDTAIDHARCAKGHSGNTRLTRSAAGYAECCGCRDFFAESAVIAAALDPASDRAEHGSGGLRTVPSAALHEARRVARVEAARLSGVPWGDDCDVIGRGEVVS